jgi:hypothetical protein
MIVMNMDSNIKHNVDPITWLTIETQLASWCCGLAFFAG